VSEQPETEANVPTAKTGDCCANCKFGRVTLQNTMECRFNAPSVFMLPGPRGQPMSIGAWPPTQKQNWCGNHKIKLAVQA